jgi:hypothetical protein
MTERAQQRGLRSAFDLISQLLDSEKADYRLSQITPQDQPFEEPKKDWRSFERGYRMSQQKKAKIIAMLDSGLPPVQIAKRFALSVPTVYRLRDERVRKKAAE